jgi:tetraacyldisaccharide 4'-kinase
LLDWAGEHSLNAVVLSRGYGGKVGRRPLLVRPDTPPDIAGDEPALLARTHDQASVVVFPRRAEAARFAESCLNPDLLLLDDGMQHLALARDLDLVLLRPEDFSSGWNRVIPSGTWREGRVALGAAHAFLVKADAKEFQALLPLAQQRLQEFGKPLFSFTLAPQGLRPLFPRVGCPHPLLDPQTYRHTPYILLSGVGKPDQVEATATQCLGRAPDRHVVFPDHHAYTENDVLALRRQSSLPVVCTAKDAVKLRYFDEAWGETPVWALDARAVFGPACDMGRDDTAPMSFPDWWAERWAALGKGRGAAPDPAGAPPRTPRGALHPRPPAGG